MSGPSPINKNQLLRQKLSSEKVTKYYAKPVFPLWKAQKQVPVQQVKTEIAIQPKIVYKQLNSAENCNSEC